MHPIRQRGSFAVEFALTLSILLLLTFAIVNLALAVWNYNTLSQASREGARYGSVLGNTDGRYSRARARDLIQQRVEAYAVGLRFDAIEVSWDNGDNAPGSIVTVSASYRFHPVSAMVGSLSIPLRSSASMMISQ
ncbi:TadE/TadG family type IV pilus assembly protein [Janthinobacterium sp. UMAB-56]|uniref:TadE/TadG family type IV pilus assembly protein n=1 Tax=Janthinobacterium sp. UMAB-56 TaxID=1365361 RepID=UPI001C570588|nr:TadE family protein [Janthinobacterium sp. UMAB-56]